MTDETHDCRAAQNDNQLAFSDCSALQVIHLNHALSCIGNRAFAYCKNLTDLHCPDGLRVIGYHAFYMTGLSNITLNSGLICVMGEAFFTHCFDNAVISLPEIVLYFDRTVFSPDENITLLISDDPYHSRLHIDGVSAIVPEHE